MKLLHSSMMMSDVLAERENQIKIKEEMMKLENIRDIKYEELSKHHLRKLDEREYAVSRDKVLKKQQLARDQKSQLEAAKQLRVNAIRAEKEEGILLQERNLQFVHEESEHAAFEKQARLNARFETEKAQQYLNEVKRVENERMRKESEHILEYSKRVDEMSKLRQNRQEELFKRKQNQRQRLIDTQAAKLALIRNTADEHVTQQCRDAELEQNRLLQKREESMKIWKADIEKSRLEQVNLRETQKAHQLETQAHATEFIKKSMQDFQTDLLTISAQKLAAEKKLAADLQRQIAIKTTCKLSNKKGQKNSVMLAKQATQKEVYEFQSLAEQALADYAKDGKNVIPIVHALKTFHKNKSQ